MPCGRGSGHRPKGSYSPPFTFWTTHTQVPGTSTLELTTPGADGTSSLVVPSFEISGETHSSPVGPRKDGCPPNLHLDLREWWWLLSQFFA